MTAKRRIAGNALALILGLAIVAVAWRIGEHVFHRLNAARDARTEVEGNYYTEYLRYDDVVGVKGAPNVRVRSAKRQDGDVIYDAAYTTDGCGRRVCRPRPTPYPSGAVPKRDQFLLFFGCSYTFGEGLQDNETLPWQVAALAPGYCVYNYGCAGYGPQQMLAKIESGELSREVGERSGILVYVFIPNHVRRAIGSMRVATKWGRTFPSYVLDANGELTRQGNFTTGRPWLNAWYRRIADIDTLRFFGVDLPVWVSDRHVAFTANIIERSEALFHQTFSDSRFYVLLYPGEVSPHSPGSEFSGRRIKPFLEKAGVACIDFTDLLDMSRPEFRIKQDDHPTGEAHRRVAAALAEALRIGPGPDAAPAH